MDENVLPRGPFEKPSDAVEPPDPKTELARTIQHIAICRNDIKVVQEATTVLREALMATELGKRISQATSNLEIMKQVLKNTEAEVRSLALAIHTETGERKPHEAITIKHYKTPVIVDEVLLLEHVRIHVPQCVKLNTRQVTKLARAGLEMPWVEFEDECRATIARDLDKWLPEDE